ncbi:MAG: MarR family transcriptional regulator [Alphaproteobacteria bacterium]|nr:MarR family transcriptional regulator [Alphaproteobacteria bacterium]
MTETDADGRAEETPYRLEEQVGHLLRRAHQRASAIFQAMIGDEQVTPTQYAAMVKLHDLGELSQNHLGRLTAMDPATTQGVMRRLLDRDLIAARSDPDDKRRTLLSLSPKGRELIGRLMVNGPLISDETLKPLNEQERKTLLALLSRIS